jgi:UDP-N-acetylglucosamine--N-acetylmuramyl-(pentapeptide) pyrophosphoryl-undecaprenol N-acetylglucosamine transferase
MDKKIKIIITGGGTAGHVMPALAVIEALTNKKIDILYVGSKKGIEKTIVPEHNIEFRSITCGKFRRYWSWENLIDPFKFMIGFFQSLGIIIKFKPQVIFSKGGYVGLPIVIAGWICRKPIIVHESDTTLGLANRISLKFARRLAVSFPAECYPKVQAQKIIYTGTPVRKSILLGNKQKGQTFFQLKENLQTLLVVGGSQGAKKINNTLLEILVELLPNLQIIHLTGPSDFNKFKSFQKELPAEIKNNYKPYAFLENEIADAITCSDLIISRAGANAIFEIAIFKKPLILIPLEGHQETNAEFFARKNAALVIKNQDLNSKILLETMNNALSSPEKMQIMGTLLNEFEIPSSAEIIADEILKLAK